VGAAVEADLTDPGSASVLFNEAERRFGPVDILVNNASGWVQDTFKPIRENGLGRALSQLPMDIDPREAEIPIRQRGKLLERLVEARFPLSNGVEQHPKVVA